MPYTYIITHIPSNVKYYGVQYKKSAVPEDLGVTYFSSSKILKNLIKEEGLINFKFEVRQQFDNKEDAIRWERKFLTKINAANSSSWFNLSNGGAINPGGYKLSEITKRRMSKPKNKEHREKLKKHLDEKRKIPKWTEERKRKQSERLLGHTFNRGKIKGSYSEEHCKAISSGLIGNKNGIGKHNMKEFTCPYCNKIGKGGNMTRYHFDKCKHKSPDIV